MALSSAQSPAHFAELSQVTKPGALCRGIVDVLTLSVFTADSQSVATRTRVTNAYTSRLSISLVLPRKAASKMTSGV